MTQGSSCLATLGSGTESRWDSRAERHASSRSRVHQYGGGWMPPLQQRMRKYCGSQTSQTRAPFPEVSRLVGVSRCGAPSHGRL